MKKSTLVLLLVFSVLMVAPQAWAALETDIPESIDSVLDESVEGFDQEVETASDDFDA